MRAKLVFHRRTELGEGLFEEVVVWALPEPARASTHSYKYRFAFVADEVCVVRYDNEAGKGDHKHIGDKQLPYRFIDVRTLVADFGRDVRSWIDENRRD